MNNQHRHKALARRIHAFFRHGYPAKEDNAFLAIISGGIVMASRLFILCYVLAAKWQDDDSYGFANRVSLYANDFTQKTANILEASALEALDFNLSVSTVEWVQHLKHLKQWTLDMRSGTHRYGAHLTICCRINELLFLPNLKRRMRNVRPRVIHPSAVRKLYTALATNLQISTKSSTLSKLYSAESASWNSAADPVVKEYGRCVPF
ncbi:hypothetical protein BDZ97DRAFT_40236 [Flammula alnicola]|nr:hypothetical protein BDZ97DRAFT_40236 [Flammula alnicola]